MKKTIGLKIIKLFYFMLQPPPLEDPSENIEVVKEIIETMETLEQTKSTEMPGPHPPSCRKDDIYTDPRVFDNLDENVFKVQETFVNPCHSENVYYTPPEFHPINLPDFSN